MHRRQFLKKAFASSISLPFLTAGCQSIFAGPSSRKQPNILFIFSDDHAFQAIGAYRSWLQDFMKEQNLTPNIDKLAEAGAIFDNSFCCNSICGPSRAVIQTGAHSHINGFKTNERPNFDGSQWTFPKVMQQGGYQTAMLGKWHLGTDPTGFDHWEILPGQGQYYNPDFITSQGRNQKTGYATDLITDMAIDWLDQRDPEKPFLLMCQHKAPHRNWMPPERYLNLLDNVKIPEPDNLFDDYSGRTSSAADQEMMIDKHMTLNSDLKVTPPIADNPGNIPGFLKRLTDEQRAAWEAAYQPKNDIFRAANPQGKDLVRWKYQRYMKDYLRCIKAVDDSVGKLSQYLQDNNLADNTVLIYSSDQGFYLGEHGWFDKRWMYEESLRMPFIIRWPGVIKTRFTAPTDDPEYRLRAHLPRHGRPVSPARRYRGAPSCRSLRVNHPAIGARVSITIITNTPRHTAFRNIAVSAQNATPSYTFIRWMNGNSTT